MTGQVSGHILSSLIRNLILSSQAHLSHHRLLCLIINNFKLDASVLTKSIRVRPDHLKKLVSFNSVSYYFLTLSLQVSMVGAHLVSDSITQSQFIVLKLPLATFLSP